MSFQPPPPKPPRDPKRRRIRDIGLLIALTSPITGFILWIVVAIIIGEDRLEGSNNEGLYPWLMSAIFVVIGLAIAGRAQFGESVPRTPSRLTAAIFVGVLGFALIGLGLWSVSTTELGAPIGGGILLFAGIASIAVGIGLSRSR